MSDPNGPESVTFDELEQQAVTPPAADLTQIKLEGDNVPELIRGKTIDEAMKAFGSLEQSLKASEQARVQPQAQVAAPVVEEPKELTDDELATLYDESPIKAIQAMQEQAERRASRNLESRLAPLAAGTAATVEAAARAKYADEFALFGDQITAIASQIPNARAVLSSGAAWDDLIALVRGRAGNFDKLIEHKTQQRQQPVREAARTEQRESVGFSDSGGSRGRIASSEAGLDATQREIASNLGMTPAEYIKWSKI